MTHERGDVGSIDRRWLVGIFCFALLLRALVLLELADSPLMEVLLGDARGYFDWAQRIAGGEWRGSEVFYQAPLYPYFLAVLFTLAGPSLDTIRIAQALLGSTACVMIALAASRFFSVRAGRVAGLLLAAYPVAIFFDVIVQKTSLAGFLIAALLYFVSRFDDVESIRWPLAAGAALGALILTRENALVLLPCLALWCLLPASGGRAAERGARLVLLIAGSACLLVPVGARNLALGDQFLITTAQLGPNLYIGNHPEADGRYQPLLPDRGDVRHERGDARRIAEHALGRSLTPGEVSDYWVGRVRAFAVDRPLDFLRLLAHKFYMVVNAEEIADTESIETYADESWTLSMLAPVFHFGVLFPLAVFGVWVTRARARELVVLYLMGGAMIAATAIFFVMARYRFPLVPLLVMFAAAGIAALLGRPHDFGWRASRAGWIALGVAALVSNLPLGVVQQPRAMTNYNVAMAMLQRERLEEAQHYLERSAAVTLEPVVHLRLGDVLERRGDSNAAATHYEQMLVARRADPRELHRRLVRVYEALGREADAARHRDAIDAAPVGVKPVEEDGSADSALPPPDAAGTSEGR